MSGIVAADWRPTASLATLRLRAALLQRARQYFAQTSALEVYPQGALLIDAKLPDASDMIWRGMVEAKVETIAGRGDSTYASATPTRDPSCSTTASRASTAASRWVSRAI